MMRFEALVIRRKKREKNIQALVLSPLYGKINLIGIKAANKPLQALLEPLSRNYFITSDIQENQTALIQEIDPIENYNSLRTRLTLLNAAAEAVKSVELISFYSQPIPELYNLLISTITRINNLRSDDIINIIKFFYKDLLALEGVGASDSLSLQDYKRLFNEYAGVNLERRKSIIQRVN
jgi:recombinational DNA repair protein (RecF pathway)